MKELVPELRFSEFKGAWEEKKLGKEARFFSGGTPTSSNKNFYGGEIPFIKSGEIKGNKTEQYLTQKGFNSSSAKMVEKGDILYALYGATSGEVGMSQIEGAINQAVLCIKPFELNRIFLVELLKYNKTSIIDRYIQGGQGNLSGSIVKNLEFLFPSLPEQTKIADFLSNVDEQITLLTKKKEKLEEYKKGVMQKLFSQELRFKDENGNEYPEWEDKKLGEVANIFDGTHQTPKYVEKGIPFYSVEHVTANDFSNTKFIQEKVFLLENTRCRIEKGDVLMTRIGSIGKAKYIDWDVNASFYVSLALIKCSDNVQGNYLSHYINSDLFQMELWRKSIHVAFPKKINLGEISKCKINLPSLPEQTKIANFLSAIDNQITAVEKQLAQSKIFKQGLLQKMFA